MGAGETIGSVDSDGQTALHHAAWKHLYDSTEALELLIDAGAPINVIDRLGHTPLWEAVSKGWPPDVALLIKSGADVDLRGDPRWSTTPLMEACHHNASHNLPSVAILLAEGADVNAARDSKGMTPLHYAARSGKVEVVRMILAANLLFIFGEATHPLDKSHPFHAAWQSELVNAVDYSNYTPLHHAAEAGHADVVKVFLEEVEAVDRTMESGAGKSAIEVAEAQSHVKIAKMLREMKAASSELNQDLAWAQYQERCNFNEGDCCGLECRWCGYQNHWMSQ
ncbi:ankyrin repeat-containing domain protein [Crassisporium funariophilum]|nr:ankyrin repeat-containing domain protein [Crassisporium funariophilum]